jgi:plastocyanin
MKKYLLIILCLHILVCANAQTETYTIDWSFGSNPDATGQANSNRTIEEGDTVVWNWYANGNHNVVSDPDATESFSSPLQGQGSTFSHTFAQVGTNDYVCTPHSGNMFGTITVVPEGTLNTTDFTLNESISIYPNPTTNEFYLTINGSNSADLSISIYNALGQIVKQVEDDFDPDKSIDVSNFETGLYYVRVSGKNSEVAKKIMIR